MDAALTLSSLTKSFGKNRGVTDISLDVKPGEIVGFLGPNGAGKTTTINMILGFTQPTSGSVQVFGKDSTLEGTVARRTIGFLSNDMALDEGLTARQELEFLGKLHGNYDEPYALELADRLGAELDKKIRTLSRGNKQKIGLISALMHKPEILILDEPTSGLDPLIQATFNAIILEHKAAGRTAFISSHVLSEVEELCDRFIFIREGTLLADKSLKELRSKTARHVSAHSRQAESLYNALKTIDNVDALTKNGASVTFLFSGDPNKLVSILSKFKLDTLQITETELEQVFMNYYEGQDTI